MIKSIIVKYQFEALHHWPECPFEEVSFLKNKHRHLFYVEVEKEVTHNDRDIEIIMLKRDLQIYSGKGYDYGTWSCEEIAEDLLHKFQLKSCCVLEDNENGAKITI